MAVRKRRSLWGSISTSKKFYDNRMNRDARLLYFLMIPHQDDEGRLDGNPQIVKATVCPVENWSTNDIEELLKLLKRCRLIAWYGTKGAKVVQICSSKEHQTFHGIQKIASSYPPPPNHKRLTSQPDVVPKLSKEKIREVKIREEVLVLVMKVVDNFPIYGNIEPQDLADLINEFSKVNSVTLFNDLYTWESARERNTQIPLTRLRNFFKRANADKPAEPRASNADILAPYLSGEKT